MWNAAMHKWASSWSLEYNKVHFKQISACVCVSLHEYIYTHILYYWSGHFPSFQHKTHHAYCALQNPSWYSLSPRPLPGMWCVIKNCVLWNHPVWVWILIPPLTYCENLNKLPVHSLPLFPLLHNGNSSYTYVIGCWKGSKTSYEKCREKSLVYSEHSMI